MTNTLNNELQTKSSNWTDTEWSTFRDWIVSHLKESTVTVAFTKKDGSPRVMKCTLNPEILPPEPIHESNTSNPINFPKVKKENLNIVSVFDIEAAAWRSFTVKNVTNVTFDL